MTAFKSGYHTIQCTTSLVLSVYALAFIAATCTSTLARAQKGDIKFYNLEKEYRETQTFVYSVKNAEALELKQIVKDMLSIYGSLYVNEKNNALYITDVPEKLSDIKEVIPTLDMKDIKAGENLISKVFYLKHEKIGDISDIIKHKLSPEGRLFDVTHLNALSITDIPSKIDEVVQLLEQLDVPSPQISIDITVVDFNGERFSRLGVNIFNWLQGLSVGAMAGLGGPGNAQVSAGLGTAPLIMPSHKTTNSQSTTLSGGAQTDITSQSWEKGGKHTILKGQVSVADLAGFIAENADGKILANTRIMTRNNKIAQIAAYERIAQRSPDMFYPSPAAQAIHAAGLSVSVTPTLQKDSMINLKIVPSISDFSGWSPTGQPMIFDRSINTEVKVKDGAIYALGGLKKRETVWVHQGIPLLKDIPILGYLFSVKKKVTLEREVMVFVKPSTIPAETASRQAYEKMMEKFQKPKKR